MPELPEVETIACRLRPDLVGRRILQLEARWPKSLWPSPEAVRACEGRQVHRVDRRGKHLLLGLSGGSWLAIHLRMSGRMEWAGPHLPEPRHARTLWHLDDGRCLVMADARKFGRVIFTQDLAGTFVDLGPEPLGDGLTPAVFAARLQARDRAIKPLLLDQTFLAGLGNIYTDEALFRARLHPLTPASALTRAEATALLTAIREVLREGIAHCGTSLDWIYPDGRMQEFLRVYGRAGAPCTACGAPIVRAVLGQRGTWTCPRCQPEPGVSGYSPRHALPARRTRPP